MGLSSSVLVAKPQTVEALPSVPPAAGSARQDKGETL